MEPDDRQVIPTFRFENDPILWTSTLSGTFDSLETSTTITCVYAETASRASPVIPRIGESVSEKCCRCYL